MNSITFIILNVITGLFVAGSSLLGYAFSGIGEGSTNDARILLWFLVWVAGVVLQIKLANKVIGLVITFIPVIFFLYLYIAAIMM